MSLFLASSSLLTPTHRINNDETWPEDDTLSIPSIRIERSTTPVSMVSQMSSEPLDSELWGRQNLPLNPNGNALDSSSSYSSSSRSYLQSSSRGTSPSLEDDPPDYQDTVQLPTIPIKYNFSSISFNSMTVIPSSDAEDPRAKYHISISMNCFMPFSYITTVRRGGSGYGALVAQFEMGMSANCSTVTINGAEVTVGSILSKMDGSRTAGRWLWSPSNKKNILSWDCRTTPFTCHSRSAKPCERVSLAKFTPARHVSPGQPPVVAELIVRPAGQKIFDSILISLLIIERKRLAPGSDKKLFN